jgi:hypothetical protein
MAGERGGKCSDRFRRVGVRFRTVGQGTFERMSFGRDSGMEAGRGLTSKTFDGEPNGIAAAKAERGNAF